MFWNSDVELFCVDRCYGQLQLLPRLFYACMTYLKSSHLDLPVGLIERLVHTDVVFVQQFVSAVHNLKVRETLFSNDNQWCNVEFFNENVFSNISDFYIVAMETTVYAHCTYSLFCLTGFIYARNGQEMNLIFLFFFLSKKNWIGCALLVMWLRNTGFKSSNDQVKCLFIQATLDTNAEGFTRT